MADVTVKSISEMEAVYDGVFVRARASLGVTSFGMQVMNMPPNAEFYPEHDEQGTGHEEVYLALRGSGKLIAGGEEHALEPGVMARVGPAEKRRILPGDQGLQLLAIGGRPGQAYEPPAWSELGGSVPGSQ